MTEKATLDKILEGVQDIKVEQGRTNVHLEQHRKEIDGLSIISENLKSSQNKAIGFLTFGGIFGTAFFTWLFKHFSE